MTPILNDLGMQINYWTKYVASFFFYKTETMVFIVNVDQVL